MIELSDLYESYFSPNTIGTGLATLRNKFKAIHNFIKDSEKSKKFGAIDSSALIRKAKKSFEFIDKMMTKGGFKQAVQEDVSPENNNIYKATNTVINRLRELRRHMIAAQRVKPKPIDRINDLKINRGTIMDVENLLTQWIHIQKDLAKSAPKGALGKLQSKLTHMF